MSHVIINGIEHDINGTKLYYRDICELAGKPLGSTVTWRYQKSGLGDSMTANDDDGVYLDAEQPTIFNCRNTEAA